MSETSMRAIIIRDFGGPEQLQMWEWEKPEPGPEDLLVRIHATALNRADVLQRQGKYPPPPGASPLLGLEMAGEVVGAGSEVSGWQLGDRVCGLLAGGGYAEYCVLPQTQALAIPESWSYVQAAALPEAFLTAFQALVWLGNLAPGEKVLIHAGGSGVGTAAIQLAKSLGGEVYATASQAKHETCRGLGASMVYDYQQEDFAEMIDLHTHHKGVDLILDFIGGPYFQRNLNLLARDGRLVMLGFLGGALAEDVNLGPVLRKRLSILGSTLRNRDDDYKARLSQATQAYVWPRLETGQLRAIVDREFSWTQAADAHHYLESNQNIGKVILRID